MKKIISLMLSMSMLVMLIASCGANTDTTTTAATTEAITTEVTTVYFDYKLDSNGYVLEVTVTMEGEPYMILSLEYK